MRSTLAVVTVLGLVVIAQPGCQSEPRTAAPAAAEAVPQKPLAVEESIEVTVTATVEMIDHNARIVTLRDADGEQVTMSVDERVQRLHEVRVGDEVRAMYRATLLAELRAPTAEESASPIAVVSLDGRSPLGAAPAAGAVQAVRVVTTVEAVDVPNMRVTLRGPMGDLAVVRGRNPDNLRRLRVGDTIVITYFESIAIALQKVAPR